jgi:DNA-binding transcriptional LysR family regulator
VRLTPAGQTLLEHAETVLSTLRVAEADVAALASGDVGRLRVGVMQSVGTRIIPSLLTGFAADRPGVEIALHEAHDPQDLLDMVEAQDLDITFAEQRDPEGPFVTRAVLDDPFVVLAPNAPPWCDRPSISIEELAKHPLVGNRNPSCFGRALLAFGDHEPNFVFQSDDNTTVQSCVAAGLGVSLAPMLTIDLDDPTTTTVEVAPAVPPRQLTVSWHADRQPSALLQAFVEATVEVCAGVAAEFAHERAEKALPL